MGTVKDAVGQRKKPGALGVIADALRAGCVICVRDGQPIVTGPADAEPIVQRLRGHRADVLRLFAPRGWSRGGWSDRLRGLADACMEMHPHTASTYRLIADSVGIELNPENVQSAFEYVRQGSERSSTEKQEGKAV